MAITLNGTTGITTPDITSEAGLTVDGVSFASGAPANTLVTTSGGNVGIGTSSPGALLDVMSASNPVAKIRSNGGTVGNYAGLILQSYNNFSGSGQAYIRGVSSASGNSNTDLTFGVNASGFGAPYEAARIDSSGNLLVGTTSNTYGAHCYIYGGAGGTQLYAKQGGAGGYVGVFDAYVNGGTYYLIGFNANGTGTGSITSNGSSTSYNTSSDYRLKENVVGVTGASARVQQLNPVRFNFIADPDTTVDGFLAHEVQDVVPEAITGAKDAVDAEGNPVYQGIDQSKLVPLLTAALQEALTKIETLEARVAALEAA